MPAFGLNRYSLGFVRAVFERERIVSGSGTEEDPYVRERIGFRLSDRVQGAVDRFCGEVVARFGSSTYPGFERFAYIYLIVGGVDWSHAMNLADTDGGYGKYAVIWSAGVVHGVNGVQGGGANSTQAEGGWASGPFAENWVYKSFGFYSRTNSAVVETNMYAQAANTNGYTYTQQVIARYVDGQAYYRNCLYTGPATGGNDVHVAVADSLGLFGCSREGNLLLRCYKRNVQVGYDNVNPAVILSGQGGGLMNISCAVRQVSFVFATKHNRYLVYGEYLAFADFVQRLQVGLGRAV